MANSFFSSRPRAGSGWLVPSLRSPLRRAAWLALLSLPDACLPSRSLPAFLSSLPLPLLRFKPPPLPPPLPPILDGATSACARCESRRVLSGPGALRFSARSPNRPARVERPDEGFGDSRRPPDTQTGDSIAGRRLKWRRAWRVWPVGPVGPAAQIGAPRTSRRAGQPLVGQSASCARKLLTRSNVMADWCVRAPLVRPNAKHRSIFALPGRRLTFGLVGQQVLSNAHVAEQLPSSALRQPALAGAKIWPDKRDSGKSSYSPAASSPLTLFIVRDYNSSRGRLPRRS